MTTSGDTGDTPEIADLAGEPRLVLDDDGLDGLELVLGGWLPATGLVLARPAGAGLVLTDQENNPLALVREGQDGERELRPLRPWSSGFGPQWDPAVRLSLAEVRRRVPAARRMLACVVDDVPTRVDLDTLVSATQRPDLDAVVVLVPVARRPRPRGEVGWAGLTRAAWATADAIANVRPERPVIRLALPWPDIATPEIEPLLHDAGFVSCARVTELRSGDQHDRITALRDLLELEVHDLYPAASAEEVLRARRAAPDRGAVVFFTGLSGSGKSTIARALADVLADTGSRRVTLLDGDEVRHHLSRGLGFDAASRAANIDRIAWVAALVAAHGGIAVAAPIAPFADGRRAARTMALEHGAFVLVHVSTPLEVCEARDRKGLYARARANEIADFTGVSSPYEVADDADVTIDTSEIGVDAAVARVCGALEAALAAPRAGPAAR